MAALRHFLESLGPWMPRALVDSTVAENRARRLAQIAEHGLEHVRWREGIRKAEYARINAIREFAHARGCDEIGEWLALETNESIEAACTRLNAFCGVQSASMN
jgi:hypothetical protein